MFHWWPYRLNAHHSTRSVIVRDIKSKQLHVYSGCCPFPEQRWSSLRATAQAVPYPFEGRNLNLPGKTTLRYLKWRSQPKIFRGAKKFGLDDMFDFRRATVFCLCYRLSKHKMARSSKNLGGHGHPWLHLWIFPRVGAVNACTVLATPFRGAITNRLYPDAFLTRDV